MKKPNITEGEWKWQKFGDEYYLCGQYGMRPMVLATLDGEIAIRKDGLLEKLYPEHPDAQAISAVPDMVEALIESYKYLRTKRNIFKKKHPDTVPHNIEEKMMLIGEALEKAGVKL